VAETGVPILVKAMQSDREMLRIEAAGTLGELGEAAKAGLPALKQALNDKSPRVQEAATKAIARIEEGSPSPSTVPDVRSP
jgi:HEAT repeat protein